jgi:hypothetical protein
MKGEDNIRNSIVGFILDSNKLKKTTDFKILYKYIMSLYLKVL